MSARYGSKTNNNRVAMIPREQAWIDTKHEALRIINGHQKNHPDLRCLTIFALVAFAPQAKTITSEVFDTVIEGGRVMDLRQITMLSPISAFGGGK